MATPTITARVNWARKPAFEDFSISSNNLIGYWRFSDTNGTIATDRVGGNHGTYTGGFTLNATGLLIDDLSPDVSLDGSSGFISVPSSQPSLPSNASLNVGDVLSMLAVIKRGATGAKHQIFSKGTNAYGLYVGTDDKLTLEQHGVGDIVKSLTTLDTNIHVVAATKNAGTSRLYIDGLEVTGVVTNRTLSNSTTNLFIGQDGSSGSWFNGTLGEAQIWSVDLPPNQIATLAVAAKQGEFGNAIDSIGAAYAMDLELDQGASADYTTEKIGQAVITADNPAEQQTDFFAPERNLPANASFEWGIDPWSGASLTNITQAASLLAWGSNPYLTGNYAGQARLSATSNSGVYTPIEGLFPAGQSLIAQVGLQSVSGNTNIEIGFASVSSNYNQARSSSLSITPSYALYTVSWQPNSDTTDAVFFVRTTTAAAAVVNIDTLQVNTGTSLVPYIEGPTRPLLTPGANLHAYQTFNAASTGLFFGQIQRIEPDPETLQATITAYDPLQTLTNTTINDVWSASTVRDVRYAVLDDATQAINGQNNLLANGHFLTNTDGWQLTNASRVTSPSFMGGSSLKVQGNGQANTLDAAARNLTNTTYKQGRYYTLTFWAMLVGAADILQVSFFAGGSGTNILTTGANGVPSPTSTAWTKYSLTVLMSADTTTPTITFIPQSGISGRGVYIDGVTIVQGTVPPTVPIDFSQPTGRQFNYISAGGYEAAEVATQWTNAWANKCFNGSFPVNTNGWSIAVDAFCTGAGASIAQVGATSLGPESNVAQITPSSVNLMSGAHYLVPGTMLSGQTYVLSGWISGGFGTDTWHIGIGSNGTPADKIETTFTGGTVGVGRSFSISWKPLANRTDAHIYAFLDNSVAAHVLSITAITLTLGSHNYAREGIWNPVAMTEATSVTTTVDGVSHPTMCTQVVTKATRGSGAMLSSPIPQIANGVMTLSIKLRATSGTPTVYVGIGDPYGANSNVPVAWRTFTLSTSWQQFPVTLQGLYSNVGNGTITTFVVTATNTAITVNIDDVQLTAGTAVQPYLVTPASGVDKTEADIVPSYTVAATAAESVLSAVNKAFLARHWIAPQMSRPWYWYTSFPRTKLQSMAVAETFIDLSGDGIQALTGFEKDRSTAVRNAIVVAYNQSAITPGTGAGATVTQVITASDPVSIARYGVVPFTGGDSQLVNGPTGSDTTAQQIATMILARFKSPRSRPILTSENHWGSGRRQINDLLLVTHTRSHLYLARYVILSMKTSIKEGGLYWVVQYELEEFVSQVTS